MKACRFSLLVIATLASVHAAWAGCASIQARWVGGSSGHAVAVDPGVVAVDTGTAVTFVDIADPALPVAAGQVDLGAPVTGLAAGGFAVAAITSDGVLWIIDPTDLRRPVVRATVGGLGDLAAVAAFGSLVAVAELGQGVQLFDVSDPDRPAPVAFVDTPGGARDVALAASRLVIADGWAGVMVVSLDPSGAPVGSASVTLPDRVLEVVTDAGIALARTRFEGAWVLDLSEPALPRVASRLPADGPVMRVALAGATAVSSAYRLEVFDVGVPAAPVVVGAAVVQPQHVPAAVVTDGVLLVDELTGGLLVYGGHDDGSPRRLGEFSPPARFARPAPAGDGIVAVVGGLGSLRILDLSVADAPREAAVLTPPSGGERFVAVTPLGDGVLAVTSSGRLTALDVADPAAPRVVASRQLDDRAIALDAVGGRIVVGGPRRLTVLDGTRPGVLRPVGGLDRPTFAVGAASGRAAAADFAAGLTLADLDPHDGAAVASTLTRIGWDVRGLAFERDLLAVAAGGAGLRLLDVGDTAHPAEVAAVDDVAFWAHGCDLRGGAVAVGWGQEGWSLLDVSAPGAPNALARGESVWANAVRLERGRLYTVGHDGLAVFDLATCASAPPVARFELVRGWPTSTLAFALVDRSLGLPSTLRWELPDGTVSAVPTVRVQVPRAGVSRVSLTVAGPLGSDAITRDLAIGTASSRRGGPRVAP